MVDAAMKHHIYTGKDLQIIRYLSSNITNEHSWLPTEKHELSNYVRKLIRGSAANTRADGKEHTNKYNMEFPSIHMIIKKIANSTLVIAYIGVKLLYLANALFQLFLMNIFLSNQKYSYYGWQVLKTIWSGQADLGGSSDSHIFPRITVIN